MGEDLANFLGKAQKTYADGLEMIQDMLGCTKIE